MEAIKKVVKKYKIILTLSVCGCLMITYCCLPFSHFARRYVGFWSCGRTSGMLSLMSEEELALSESELYSITLTLHEDGTAEFYYLGENHIGTWKVLRLSAISINYCGRTENLNMSYSLVHDTWALKLYRNGLSMYFKKAVTDQTTLERTKMEQIGLVLLTDYNDRFAASTRMQWELVSLKIDVSTFFQVGSALRELMKLKRVTYPAGSVHQTVITKSQRLVLET